MIHVSLSLDFLRGCLSCCPDVLAVLLLPAAPVQAGVGGAELLRLPLRRHDWSVPPHFSRQPSFIIANTSTQPFQQKNDEPLCDWTTFTLRAQCLDLTRAQSNSSQSLFRSGPSRNTVILVPPVSVLASYWPLIQH